MSSMQVEGKLTMISNYGGDVFLDIEVGLRWVWHRVIVYDADNVLLLNGRVGEEVRREDQSAYKSEYVAEDNENAHNDDVSLEPQQGDGVAAFHLPHQAKTIADFVFFGCVDFVLHPTFIPLRWMNTLWITKQDGGLLGEDGGMRDMRFLVSRHPSTRPSALGDAACLKVGASQTLLPLLPTTNFPPSFMRPLNRFNANYSPQHCHQMIGLTKHSNCGKKGKE
ncbi:unnamed protein product [Hydatigera taeniaeformis]|uniref:LAM_G_DOMAIN domain-containing protein n=1 Tax=Hydatigena taeniaeformis TaxID=6205 RepID=A0A0R3XC40_HYDTA|nr:unnamed protein product [Hydatigera taeniaeformis]